MKRLLIPTIGTILLLGSGSAWTQDDGGVDGDALDLTMTLLPENAALPEEVTRTITLPPAVFEQAGENAADERSANGLDQANGARSNREAALELAEQAGAGGDNHGQTMRELARELVENAGRGEPPETPGPGNSPNPPGPPQN